MALSILEGKTQVEAADWPEKLREGDEKAFTKIFRHFWPALYSIAYKHVRDKVMAEEAVQELFATLWLKRSQIVIHTSLKAYLFTAIRNQVYDQIAKQTVRKRVHQQLILTGDYTSHRTEDELAYEELTSQLSVAVKSLPETPQTIFRKSRFDFLSVPEIAKELDLSPKTVEYHLTKALKILRRQLKDFLTLLIISVHCFN